MAETESENDVLDSRRHVTTTPRSEGNSRRELAARPSMTLRRRRYAEGRSELMSDLIHRIDGVGHGAKMKLLEFHLVLRKRARLVAEEVLDSTELLGEGAGPDDGLGDLVVVHDLVGVDRLAHVEVDAEAVRREG